MKRDPRQPRRRLLGHLFGDQITNMPNLDSYFLWDVVMPFVIPAALSLATATTLWLRRRRPGNRALQAWNRIGLVLWSMVCAWFSLALWLDMVLFSRDARAIDDLLIMALRAAGKVLVLAVPIWIASGIYLGMIKGKGNGSVRRRRDAGGS